MQIYNYKNLSMVIKLLLLIAISVFLFRFINFLPTMPASIYYSIFALFALIIISFKSFKVNLLVLLFIILSYLSIMANDIPVYFHPYERFLGFVILIVAVGPLIKNKELYNIRLHLTKYLMVISVVITVISFVLYFLYKPITISLRGNLFCGITSHSMQMGPIAGMSCIYLINYFFNKINIQRKSKVFLIVITIVCLLSCVLAGSRAALFATLGALVIWAWVYFNSIKTFILYLSCSLLIVFLTAPLWWSYTETIQGKMAYAEKKGSLIATRQGLWERNIKSFKDNPFFGSGFASMDIGKKVVKSDYKGTIEPGSGWLYILGSCGILSFSCFLIYYIKLFICLSKIKEENALLLLSLLTFFFIHSFAESYILSAGNILFFYLWSTLGTASLYLAQRNNEDLEQNNL